MLKRNWSLTGVSLAAIIFYAVCGLLLLLLPSEALAIANYAIAALLLVMGVACIVGYCRGSVIIGRFGFLLAVGLVLVTLAVVMFCYPTFLAGLLPVIWGTSLLIGGFGNSVRRRPAPLRRPPLVDAAAGRAAVLRAGHSLPGQPHLHCPDHFRFHRHLPAGRSRAGSGDAPDGSPSSAPV